MRDKLKKLIAAYEELEKRMVDPAVVSDPKEYARIAKEHANQADLVGKAKPPRIALLNKVDLVAKPKLLPRMAALSATGLFDEIVRGTRHVLDEQREAGMLVEMSDPEMTTLLVVMMGLAPVMMRSRMRPVRAACAPSASHAASASPGLRKRNWPFPS